jgi:hypothetical protein
MEFHQIMVAVRPTRAAVRMGRYEGWEHSALRALEVLSVVWGGARDIIVTTNDDGVTHEQIWGAVELYDPDVWATHVRTFRGFQMQDPEGYERYLDGQAKEWQEKNGGDLDTARSLIHDALIRRGSISGWTPPAAFWERARAYLAPYWDREYGHPELISDDELPSGLLVDVTQLAPLPERVLVPQTDDVPLAARVLIAARWGALSPAARERLQERGVLIQDVAITEPDLVRVVGACWGGSLGFATELRRALAQALGHDPDNETAGINWTVLDEGGPFAMSMMGLSDFVRAVPPRSDWPLVVAVGDSADDFALAVALDRCMAPALWVPPTILGSDTVQALGNALMFPRSRDDRHRMIHLTSCSLDETALEPLAAELNQHLSNELLSNKEPRVTVSLPVPLPRNRPMTVLDTQRSGSLEDELFLGDTTGRGIRAQLPTGVEAGGPLHPLSWWNDVIRLDHQLPSRWPLNEHLVARSGSWKSRARVTRDGIAFHSHPQGFISASQRLDQIVDNPRLRFPDAKAVFEALAAEARLSLVESPAGRYTSRTADLWGGLPALITDLQQPTVRRVLDAYQSKAPSGREPGNYMLDRRYLSFQDLTCIVENSNALIGVLDKLLHLAVLRRGLCVDCDHCNYFGWYDADDTGQRFQCQRCRTESVIDSTVVKSGSPEPIWYYALAEVVYHARAHNFNVPVLALQQVAGEARSVIGMTDQMVEFPSNENTGKAEKVEIDLWGIIDGRIVLGEAKISNQLEASPSKRKKKAQRLRRAADALTADTLVMATAEDAWAPSAVAVIKQAFNGARCEIDFRVNVDPHLSSIYRQVATAAHEGHH